MRAFTAAALAFGLFANIALADPLLAPGKPAGVEQAVSRSSENFIFGLAILTAVGLGVLVATDHSSNVATSTGP